MMQQVTDSQIDPDEKFNKSEGGKGEVAVKYFAKQICAGGECVFGSSACLKLGQK